MSHNTLFTPVLYPVIVVDTLAEQSPWQCTWQHLRRRHTAFYSLWLVLALSLAALIGPLLWTLDPAAQDVTRFSQAPALHSFAVLVAHEPIDASTQPTLIQTPLLNDAPPEKAVLNLHTTNTASTRGVTLAWDALADTTHYLVYRHILPPSGIFDLGLPLSEVDATTQPRYQDQLQLEALTYYYTVLAANKFGTATRYATLMVTVQTGMTVNEAVAHRWIDVADAKPGMVITLPTHPLGTDHLGRDMLARLLQGGRVSLLIGILAPLICMLLGTLYGSIAGYAGGVVDHVMMRFTDFVIALPFLLFMILLKVALGSAGHNDGVLPIVIALILLGWPATARLVRGQVLQLRKLPYVDAARLSGATSLYILSRHILPNTLGVILVSLTFSIPTAIFTEAFLSFIGIGVSAPLTSWGAMCNDGLKVLLSHPHEFLLPATLISLFVLACNLLGEGLRDALDVVTRDTAESGT